MKWVAGSPGLYLTDPNGNSINASNYATYGNVAYDNSITNQILFVVDNPTAGAWNMVVTNITGNEQYTTFVYGANSPPAIAINQPSTNNSTSKTISWTASDIDDNADISLYYDTDNSSYDGVEIITGLKEESATSHAWDTSSVPAGSYYIYAKIDDHINAPAYAYSTGTIKITDITAPAVPAGVSATALNAKLRLGWTANTEADIAGYNVHYGTTSGNLTNILDIGNVTTYDLENLTNGTTYSIAVSAYDHTGNESANSGEVSGTPDANADNTAPAVPTGLTLNAPNKTSISVSWTKNNEADLAGYKVYYDTDGNAPFTGNGASEGMSPVTVADGNTTSINLTGLTTGLTYTVTITAYDTSGNESSQAAVQTHRLFSTLDTDQDGLYDDWEIFYFGSITATNNSSGDYDSDGLTNLQEFTAYTDPSKADTDSDKVHDKNDPNPF